MEESRFLLHELRLQNALELDEKKNLDTKASNITGYSVTFTVLFFGVGTFVLEKIKTQQNEVIIALTSLLLVGIVLAILCVICSVVSFRIREYRFVLSHDNFFNIETLPTNKKEWYDFFDENEIENWICDFNTKEDYEDFMIKEHLIALSRNSKTNDLKAKWIRKAHFVFILAVCMIPSMLVLILIWGGLGIISVG